MFIEPLLFEKRLGDLICLLIENNAKPIKLEHCEKIILKKTIEFIFLILIKNYLKNYNLKLTTAFNKKRSFFVKKLPFFEMTT